MIGPVIGVLFDGFAYGMLLFLLSVGLSVTLGMMNFVNLAHCAFAMLGGYVTVTLMNQFKWPFFATLPTIPEPQRSRTASSTCLRGISHPLISNSACSKPSSRATRSVNQPMRRFGVVCWKSRR